MSRPTKPLWRFRDRAAASTALDVVGMGECSLDTIDVVDAIPRPGGKQRILESFDAPGGQVATALLACSRLGLRCAYLGSVGNDAAGQAALAPLADAGIALDGVRRMAGAATRMARILVERGSGERAVLQRRDPRLTLSIVQLRREEVLRGRVLHLDAGDLDAACWAAGVAREEGVPVVLDVDAPAPGLEKLLSRVDFPIVSGEFAEEYFGTPEPADSLRGLAALGARFAVVTLGARGAVGGDGTSELHSPAFPVTVRDTTGAGDVFHAAFVWGLLQGFGGPEILGAANGAAALSCRAYGAQGGLPTRDELLAFLHERGEGGPSAPADG